MKYILNVIYVKIFDKDNIWWYENTIINNNFLYFNQNIYLYSVFF